MQEWKFKWYVDHMPKATKECPWYYPTLLALHLNENKTPEQLHEEAKRHILTRC